jgi:RecJ-like exonuclease
MTDRITCPECDGRGEDSIGPLRMQCEFCQGRGWVGGEFEPADGGCQRTDGYRNPEEGEDYDPDIHGPLPAVGEHPAVSELGVCPTCLGMGKVINLGDLARGDVHGKLIEQPCPACSTS